MQQLEVNQLSCAKRLQLEIYSSTVKTSPSPPSLHLPPRPLTIRRPALHAPPAASTICDPALHHAAARCRRLVPRLSRLLPPAGALWPPLYRPPRPATAVAIRAAAFCHCRHHTGRCVALLTHPLICASHHCRRPPATASRHCRGHPAAASFVLVA